MAGVDQTQPQAPPPDTRGEPSPVERAARGRGPAAWLVRRPTTVIALVLLGLVLVFALLRFESFASAQNIRNIFTTASVLLVIAVGMTFVIITAGIDLSVGSVVVFSGVIAAKVMGALGGEGLAAILLGLVACLASGLGWGMLNGFLIAKARVPPLIVTLGTLGMALGSALIITRGINLRDVPTELTISVGIGRFLGIPYLVLIAAAVTAAGAIALALTRFGRYTYAIGSNEEAARRAGIDVGRHLIKVYALSGFLAGLAGFMSLARFGTTELAGHQTDNLQAIAAAVIGGTSLFGGLGTIGGSVVGAFIPAVLRNGLVISHVQSFWQNVAIGAVLILAVFLDQRRRRAEERM